MPNIDPAHELTAESAVLQAVEFHRAGRADVAASLYRHALAQQPDHPEARHNLGIIMLQAGQTEAGLDHLRIALEKDAARVLYWLSYARGLLVAGREAEASGLLEQARLRGVDGPGLAALQMQLGTAMVREPAGEAKASPPQTAAELERLSDTLSSAGRHEEAIALLSSAVDQDSSDADRMLCKLGDLLTEQGSFDQAIKAYRRALALNPRLAVAHYHLGSVLSEHGRVTEGFAHFMQHAELAYGEGAPLSPEKPHPAHRIKHDREQHDYLKERGIVAADGDYHLGDGSRVDGYAVNPVNASENLLKAWRSSTPGMVVIENFLTTQALHKLRNYCAVSTIWRRNYDAGYIGATPPDGFACPLLAQIEEEISELYRDILTGHPFKYLGAFKYDSALSTGTNTHADFSAINVNFYIADDAVNLDPDSGGMLIWDIEATSEAELRRYNSDETALTAHLKRSGAKATHIPHRSNRAVIFRSALYHKTDECSFSEGYLNKRINVSLLYGDWVDSGDRRVG